jgi:hypothetical protein
MAIDKGLFDFMRKPSILGGPNFYDDIVKRNGMNSRYSHYFQHHENLPFEIFFDDKKEVYLYHFQVQASDTNIDTIYDIVIEFHSNDPLVTKDANLRNYDFRIYSNSPGFSFTYAYVYNKYKLLIPSLKDKYDDSYLHDPPKKLNPKLALGFDYTLYLCMRFLQLNSYLITKNEIHLKGKPLSKFRSQDIATAIEALDSRTGADKNAFKKLANETKRTMKKVTAPVRDTVSSLGNKFKKLVSTSHIIKPSKGTTKLVKKAKVSKVVKPRKKR